MKKFKSIYLFSLLFVVAAAGCRKLVEVDAPITNPTSASLYTSDAKAASVLTSIYDRMSGNVPTFAQGQNGISFFAGLSADELETYPTVSSDLMAVYTNSPSAKQTSIWKDLYKYIYVANAAIEGIEKSTGGMTDSVKNRLTGEAKFMRAFLHFYAINLYGDAPLITSTDYRANAMASRTPKADVYKQIIVDLKDAENLLNNNYVTPTGAITTERVRPNKGAAIALLARTYLYTGDWENAEAEATKVIDNTAMYGLITDPDKVFLKNSKEALWQLQPVLNGYNSYDGYIFIRTTTPNALEPASLRADFLNNFEAGDKRKTAWVDSITVSSVKYYFPSKYNVKGGTISTPVTEYQTIMRLAEVYLIRAEARAQQSNVSGAQADLNVIRTRALLGGTTAGDKTSLLAAVEHERQIELFTEWGHRWLDLKRTGKIDEVMSVVTPLKGGTWNTNMQLYPIPGNEIILNPNLQPQNPGYN
jgi:hypothetical protein